MLPSWTDEEIWGKTKITKNNNKYMFHMFLWAENNTVIDFIV